MIVDTETIKGFLLAGSGFTVSQIDFLTEWVGLLINIVSFAVILVHLFRIVNKLKLQRQKPNNMRLDNGDDESGRGSQIDPEGEQEDDDGDN